MISLINMKKGVFFTIDSLIAAGIVILAIFIIPQLYSSGKEKSNIDYVSQDLVNVFSTLTVGKMKNEYVQDLISNGYIVHVNNTIFEQLGEFWLDNKLDLAENFTRNITEDIVSIDYGFSVLIDGNYVYSRNLPIKNELISSKKISTQINKDSSGYTSTILLMEIMVWQ